MKVSISQVSIAALILCLSSGQALATTDLPDCQSSTASGTLCQIKVKDLHPTQFAVGSVAVECKRKKIEKKHEKDKLEKYLADPERQVPAVVGPDGNLYITDHHHLTTALYRAKDGDWKGKDQKVQVNILENFGETGISMEEFWNIMKMQTRVWPYDEKGDAVEEYGEKLPSMDMGDLKDNPYRTLSRWTRESCGYIKEGKEQCLALEATKEDPTAPYYMEFYWARFLREELKKSNADLDDPKKLMEDIYPEAIQVTLDKEKTGAFFKEQGLDAQKYGQNQKGRYLSLSFSDDACEEWYLEKD
ncbi:MAG: ParB/Srx family N-terminal domain-containing protein [Candidatus Electrothrix aestuarii]|uniref:ParB/Srx family N-terminal domain-containing protein n=1 Tax=Candidatus Electrothrix aestuarii TaxID=3062594 RepID=A0AAU8LSP0_9BACT|nr:ParB/Srx family N-terminal domain-containing protein [Candidatus Electrothrix aestuarii]